jgi:hypothetical protein
MSINSEKYTFVPPIGQTITTIYDVFAYCMFNHNRVSPSNLVATFEDLLKVYKNDDVFAISYTEDSRPDNIIVFDYREHLQEINKHFVRSSAILSAYSESELSEIEEQSEVRKINPMLYIERFYDPNVLMRIEGGAHQQIKVLSEDKLLTTISERLAYHMHKIMVRFDTNGNESFADMGFKDDDFEITYRKGCEWYIYDVASHYDEINAIYKRFHEILSVKEEQLLAIEEFTQSNHFNDPLALNKICHRCGRNTNFYNDACSKRCDEIVEQNPFECMWGPNCPLCNFACS